MLAGLCVIILRKALLVTSYTAVYKPQCYLFSILQLRIIIEGFVGKDIVQAIAGCSLMYLNSKVELLI